MAGAPEENTNAEKWSLEKAESFFDQALEMVLDPKREYDFIGEVARDMNSYKEIFTYLSQKFTQLSFKHKQLISSLEANCFYNGKKSNIVPSLAIMNLKSNHGWTDRVDNTTAGDKITNPIPEVKVTFKDFSEEDE